MTRIRSPSLRSSRRKPIAAGIASLFALAAPTATLAAAVGNCLDDGTSQTLRSVIAAASPGDTIDMSALACSTISLAQARGYLAVGQNDLTLLGPNASTLKIDASALETGGSPYSYTIKHTGSGTLTIQYLTVSGGHPYHYNQIAVGGCISSQGSVYLDHSTVKSCTAHSSYYRARGAGVYTKGNLTLSHSTISGNALSGFQTSDLKGGGAYSKGTVTLKNLSNISYNTVDGDVARGGGVYSVDTLDVEGGSVVTHNTVTSNNGVGEGGGAFAKGNLTIDHASVSYNSVTANFGVARGGGAHVAGNVTIDNTASSTTFRDNGVISTSDAAKGGAAFVAGSFSASGGTTVVKNNSANAPVNLAAGGGLYTVGGLTLAKSTVTHNVADGQGSRGAGVYCKGDSSLSYSSFTYNTAYNPAAYGAGLLLKGANNTIASSTVAHNLSYGNVGGVNVLGLGAGNTFELRNSTISSNVASAFVGGLYADSANVHILNSTIAFNVSGGSTVSPGVHLGTASNSMTVNLQSTLISNNSVGSDPDDMTIYEKVTPPAHTMTFNAGPANNLVYATVVTKLPADTKKNNVIYCPFLGPLRNNGGLTETHALMSGSQAINAGNDSVLTALYDQRGSAATNGALDYSRYSGSGAIADIGAYEVQYPDTLFNSSFDGCLTII